MRCSTPSGPAATMRSVSGVNPTISAHSTATSRPSATASVGGSGSATNRRMTSSGA